MVVGLEPGAGTGPAAGAGRSMRVIRDWRRQDITRPNDDNDDDDIDDDGVGSGGGSNSATSGNEVKEMMA